MNELFSSEPVRPPARRGRRTMPMRRAPAGESGPQRDRDPNDVAIAAARVLATSGRLVRRVDATARKHHVDPYLMRLLLLFAEHNQPLRIGNIADFLNVSHPTASRAATRAQAAGLVDKFESSIDRREVVVRLSHPGRAAVTRCLDAIRFDAAEILRAGAAVSVLGPPPYLRRTSENSGWRAGVRIGMHDE